MSVAGRPRLQGPYFDALYAADPDPWDFATSAYEREKYDATIAALGERRFARGLEVGCSIGVLTERLAARCDTLVAVDVAQAAVDAARARLAARPGVDVRRESLPEEWPEGTFDLIVASEVLYYFDRATPGRRAAPRPGGAAAPGRPAARRPLAARDAHLPAARRRGPRAPARGARPAPGRRDVRERYVLDVLERTA